MGQRMFVAVRPSEGAVEDLEHFLEPRQDAADFPFVRSSQWHLTLSFMASVSDHALGPLEERLAEAAARHAPFVASIGGAGVFPDPLRAKVLWLGLADGAPELAALAGHVRAACEVSGAPVDGQPFVPHLTVARLRRPLQATRWLQVLETYRGPTWRVESIDLVASHLRDGRHPRHEVIGTYPLSGA